MFFSLLFCDIEHIIASGNNFTKCNSFAKLNCSVSAGPHFQGGCSFFLRQNRRKASGSGPGQGTRRMWLNAA